MQERWAGVELHCLETWEYELIVDGGKEKTDKKKKALWREGRVSLCCQCESQGSIGVYNRCRFNDNVSCINRARSRDL